MAIDIRTQSLFPVRRDKQISTTRGGFSSFSSIGGGGSFIDPSTYRWDSDTSTLYVYGNVQALGEVTAFSATSAPLNWWDSMPTASGSVLGGIKLGNGLYWVNGKVDVSVNTGGIGDVTKVYVDGSLATRDTAIGTKQPQLNGTGFVKASGTTISYDNNTYLTGITSGQVTGALGFTPANNNNPYFYNVVGGKGNADNIMYYNSATGQVTYSPNAYALLANTFKQVTYQDLNVYDDFTNAKYGLTHVNTPTGDFGYYLSYGTGSYGGQTFIDYSGNDYFYYRGISNGTPRPWKQLAPINSPTFTGTIGQSLLKKKVIQLAGPGANAGAGKWYIRLQPSSAGNTASVKVTVGLIGYSWAAIFGWLTAEYAYYQAPGAGSVTIKDFRVTSTTGEAYNSMRIGDLEIENGYVSIPVWCSNTNNPYAIIEWFDGEQISPIATGWMSDTFPQANFQSIQGNLNIGTSGNYLKLNNSVNPYYTQTDNQNRLYYDLQLYNTLTFTDNNWNTGNGVINGTPVNIQHNGTTKLYTTVGGVIVNAWGETWGEGLNIDSPNGTWGGIKFRTIGRSGWEGNWHLGYDSVHSTVANSNLYLYNGAGIYTMTWKQDGTTLAGGNLNVNGEVTAYYSSDERLKTNIKPFRALDIIDQLNPKTFQWNDKAKDLNNQKDDRKNYGLIAQEVEEILPELIHNIYDEYKSVDYVQLVPVLLQAIKEQQIQIDELKRMIKY